MNHLQSLSRVLNEADIRISTMSIQSNVVKDNERGLTFEIVTLTGQKVSHWFKGTDSPLDVANEVLSKINK